MNAFLLVTLSAQPPFTYRQPLLALVREVGPDWARLDVDAFSDETLVGNAARLVREAEKVVVVFKVLQPDAPLGACQQVLEELIQRKEPAAVLLQGSHRRLQAIFQARPQFFWRQADNEAALVEQVTDLLHQGDLLR